MRGHRERRGGSVERLAARARPATQEASDESADHGHPACRCSAVSAGAFRRRARGGAGHQRHRCLRDRFRAEGRRGLGDARRRAVGRSELRLEDLTHEIPAFNIWEGAYRLNATAPYWPPGTVFVSVIDPGVGTERKSVVLKTKSGHYFVSPDNGTLTLVAERLGIEAVREIDESRFRRPGSDQSYTFHGRDVYSYAAAHLASGQTGFEQIGPALPPAVVTIDYQKPAIEGGVVRGNIPVLDVQYGNVWTNIDRATFERLGVAIGEQVVVRILKGSRQVFKGNMPYVATFGDVAMGETLLYLNSIDDVAFAITGAISPRPT